MDHPLSGRHETPAMPARLRSLSQAENARPIGYRLFSDVETAKPS
jgi:hypothetical protein